MTSILMNRELIEKGLQLVHDILTDNKVPEELRLRLVEWRTDMEWELERIDNVER